MFDSIGLGNMVTKESSMTKSDERLIGDDLNYTLGYEYEDGYAHRVKRIWRGKVNGVDQYDYYKYDANGNIIAEQTQPFTDAGSAPDNFAVQDLGDGVYVADYA